MNYECPTEFNVATSLLSCNGYQKRLRESTELMKYRFDIRPQPACFMTGQNFQGQQMAQRAVPPSLLDVEATLKRFPILEERNCYNLNENINRAKPPKMPPALSNRLIIPDCREILGMQRTKIHNRLDNPQIAHRIENNGKKNANYMRPGRDTRAEMKEAYTLYEDKEMGGRHIYGIGKFDKTALKPGTNPKCSAADSDNECMHVYGGDAVRTGTVLDPTLTFGGLLNAQDVAGGGLISAGGDYSAETKRIADEINGSVPYSQLLGEVHQKNSANIRFYNYTPANFGANCPA
jgi:hypothetical protein